MTTEPITLMATMTVRGREALQRPRTRIVDLPTVACSTYATSGAEGAREESTKRLRLCVCHAMSVVVHQA